MLSQEATKDFIIQQLEQLSPDRLADVVQFIEFLQFRAKEPSKKVRAVRKHAAFGIWADRPEAQDAAGFAQSLR